MWEVIRLQTGTQIGSLYGIVLLSSTAQMAEFLIFGGKDHDVYALKRAGIFKTSLGNFAQGEFRLLPE